MGKTIKRMHFLRWDTLLIALEMLAVVFLALMPAAWPDQICQVTLNFVCAMQFNTYRQMEGVPAATTFVTNHIRQIGSNLAKLVRLWTVRCSTGGAVRTLSRSTVTTFS